MKGAWRVAQVAGVDFYVHWSFSLMIPWLIFQGTVAGHEIEALFFIVVILLLLFGCVALHELGHALTALRLNVMVRNVTLLPIGGLAQIQAVPDKPLHEFFIAVAGPLVNLGLALGAACLLFLIDPTLLTGFFVTPLTTTRTLFLYMSLGDNPLIGCLLFIFIANVMLFAFNLIPTFPMDGGRMVRALLALVLSYKRATQLAIALGQLVAISMVCAAFHWRHLGLLLIALFVFIASLPTFVGRRKRAVSLRRQQPE